MTTLLLTSENLMEGFSKLDTYDLSDDSIPLIIDYDFVIVDLSKGETLKGELIDELFRAIEIGSTIIFLLSESSDLSTVKNITQLDALKTRVGGTNFKFTRKIPKHLTRSIISKYSIVLKKRNNWSSVAFLKVSDAMIAGLKYLDRGVVGIFPSPDQLNESYIQALFDLTVWWKQKNSPLKQAKYFISIWSIFFLLLSFTVSFLRYSQRNDNLYTYEQDWLRTSDVNISRWDLDSETATALWWESLPPKVNDQILKEIGMSNSEYLDIANELGRQNIVNELVNQKAEYDIYFTIYWLRNDLFKLMDKHYYRRAEIRARQIIKIMNKYKYFFDNQQAQKVHHARELLKYNFLQTSIEFEWSSLIDSDYIEYSKLLVNEFDPSLADDIAYFKIADSFFPEIENENYYFERVNEWKKFIQQYPYSEKIDEAAFNIILLDIKLASKHDEMGQIVMNELSRLKNDVNDFVARYPTSYLADDALYYLAIFSAEANKIDDCVQSTDLLLQKYYISDHAYKLQTEYFENRVINKTSLNQMCSEWRSGYGQ